MSDKSIERFEDMSPNGKLILYQQTDGDIIVAICPDREEHPHHFSVSAEFCMPGFGGGQSPNTLKALRALWDAMELDNKEYPQNNRG